MSKNVHDLGKHPRRVEAEIRELARDLSKVDYSLNINELSQSRKVSLSGIWKCLEEGRVVKQHLHHEENGTYAKLHDVIAGVQITVDVLIEKSSQRLIVLWAEEIEEE